MIVIVLVIFIILLVAVFSVQNAMPVTISFLAWRFDASLAIVVLLVFLTGMIAGMSVLAWFHLRRKARQKKNDAGPPPATRQGSSLV